MTFRTMCTRFHIPPGYDYIWPTVARMPILVVPIGARGSTKKNVYLMVKEIDTPSAHQLCIS